MKIAPFLLATALTLGAALHADIGFLDRRTTTLVKKYHTSVYLELSSGWQRNFLKHSSIVTGGICSCMYELTNTANLFQTDLQMGALFFKAFYVRGDAGYGVLGGDSDHFKRFNDEGDVVRTYHKRFHRGFGWNWLAAGGFHIRFYHKLFAFEPEMGYMWQKLKINHSSQTRIKAPFVGARLFTYFGKTFSWNIFYDYLFSAKRQQQFEYVPAYVPGFTKIPRVEGSVNAYRVGSGLAYTPWKHWSFSLEWQLFHANGKRLEASHGLLNTAKTRLKEWMLNQLEVGAVYKF